MSNFIVYDINGKAQIMDRPYDVVLLKKSYVENFADVDTIKHSQTGATIYVSRHYPPSGTLLTAWRPRAEAVLANKKTFYNHWTKDDSGNDVYQINGNPMGLYYFALDYDIGLYKKSYGVEVFDDQGGVTWASYQTSMNVVDTISYEDVRSAGANMQNIYNRNFGHTAIAVIPVANPTFQIGRDFVIYSWFFDEYGALRVELIVEMTLTNDEVNQGVFHAYPTYRLEFIIIDVSNARNFVNDPSVLVNNK